MNKIATFLSEKLAGKLDDLAHRDMRPQREETRTNE